ncbi:MAG: hypothetical protein UX13_C0014G0004 [Candidatus Woesebacteria bacterium GW2011_GWB1_45_5]|uniref:Uncharacterized protein n=1 Tax=Candidatus Woesebacteria bacterium GW2011_GWB1_45_5 TaxID=1618581 RepID=A0A0G1MPR4_9BACT|nr:MAG: hypothetical protein UX13_C0014G0004 [Candidatus Woesebacteria bacterium GW2011_GWB1_45_5]
MELSSWNLIWVILLALAVLYIIIETRGGCLVPLVIIWFFVQALDGLDTGALYCIAAALVFVGAFIAAGSR